MVREILINKMFYTVAGSRSVHSSIVNRSNLNAISNRDKVANICATLVERRKKVL